MNDHYKINWSARSHNYIPSELKIAQKIMKFADPLTKGKYLMKFEKDFKKYLNTKGAVFGVTSAASAIELTAASLNLKPGDEIIVPAHTYCASALPFTRYRVKIKWVDIDLNTMLLSVNHLKKLIGKKTKAVVAVHLYGQPANIIDIKKILKKKKNSSS